MTSHIFKLTHAERFALICEMAQLVIPKPENSTDPDDAKQLTDSCILAAVVARECFPELNRNYGVELLVEERPLLNRADAANLLHNAELCLRDFHAQWVCRVRAVKYFLRTWFPGVEKRQVRVVARIPSLTPYFTDQP